MPDNQDKKIIDRFKSIRNELRLNQVEFAELAIIKQSQISAIESGKRNITAAIKIALEDNLRINRDWLETGKGEMFLQNEENNADKINEPRENMDSQSGNKVNTDKGAPYYENISASAGLDYLIDNDDNRTSAFIKVPGIKVDGYINVFGDSMYPKYCAGEVIGVKATEKGLVFFGHAYVIQMTDGEAYIKYIRRGKDENHWVLDSENEKYDPREFHLSKITKVFKIKAIIARVSL